MLSPLSWIGVKMKIQYFHLVTSVYNNKLLTAHIALPLCLASIPILTKSGGTPTVVGLDFVFGILMSPVQYLKHLRS